MPDCLLIPKIMGNPDIDGYDFSVYLVCPDDHVMFIHYEPLWYTRDLAKNELLKLIEKKLDEVRRELELEYRVSKQ